LFPLTSAFAAIGVPTLLSIDDHTYSLTYRVAWLRAHGCNVVFADRPEAAVECFLNNPIDAVLLDCHMERSHCVAAHLKQLRPKLPIIMLASYCGAPCYECGVVTACLRKGEHPSAILQCFDTLLPKTRPLAA
jgi:CheY-like chemotaxis protein